MSSSVEGIENFGDDECSSPEEDSTEISRINSHENINRQIDQSVLLHEIIKCVIKQNYLAPLKKDAKRCLELGYSSGILMMELASEFENCEFHGLDKKSNAPNEIYPHNCHFEKGDFYERIPYPDEHFDYVYLRCTMLFVQKDKYNLLLRELNRVLKKGGWIEFTEMDQEFRSKGPICKSLEEILNEQILENNGDPQKVRRLGSILPENGFVNVKESTYDIPLGDHGGKIGISMANFWRGWAQIYKDHIISKVGDKDQQEFDEYIEKGIKEFDEYNSFVKTFNFIAQKA